MSEGKLTGELPLFTDVDGRVVAIEVFNGGEGYLWAEAYTAGETARMPSSHWSTPVPPNARRIIWKSDEPQLMHIGLIGNGNRYEVNGVAGP